MTFPGASLRPPRHPISVAALRDDFTSRGNDPMRPPIPPTVTSAPLHDAHTSWSTHRPLHVCFTPHIHTLCAQLLHPCPEHRFRQNTTLHTHNASPLAPPQRFMQECTHVPASCVTTTPTSPMCLGPPASPHHTTPLRRRVSLIIPPGCCRRSTASPILTMQRC